MFTSANNFRVEICILQSQEFVQFKGDDQQQLGGLHSSYIFDMAR